MSVYVWHDKTIIRRCDDDRILNNMKSIVLNHPCYTDQLLDENKIHSILQLHSILYAPPQRSVNHVLLKHNEPYYLIPVFLMDAIGLFLLDGQYSLSLKRNDPNSHMLHEVRIEQKTADLRRLERYAVRAVYAMGLDYACVYAQIHRSGRAVITHIDINPLQSEQVNDLYSQAVNAYEEGWLNEEHDPKRAVFGMDPEFLLRNTQGKIVPASRYFSAKGGVGYDSATVLGRKHIHPLVELRPEPSENLEVLVKNLRRTMWMAAAQITDHSLQWIAGGMPIPGLPLGGHLHISGIRLNTRLIRAMDNYLALPLIMIEDTSTRGRRKRYGRLGDVRRPSHGGFEYRTLPSWIVSPRVTKGVLALASLIVQHYDVLVDRPLDCSDILLAYNEGNKHVLEPIVRNIWKQLESTTGYMDHRIYLEPLKNWIMEKRIWNEQSDFRAVWRIPPFN
jgi:hypothetical protein